MYPQVFGKYVLERELARGGMARVVLATLRGAGGFEKKLVVKQIRDELACDDEFVRRFVEEAKTTVALSHPNIVPVYELGVELGTYFLAMELVQGASLAEILRASTGDPTPAQPHAGLTPEEGAYVGVEVCRALDYAHRRMNVVHRDVTPRNVMVDEEGQVKVIDFGIAAPVATTPSGHGVFGSPGHMPPEQIEARQLTPAADVFAVATLLVELWSTKPPFRRKTLDEIDSAMRGPHPKPSDSDPRLLPLDEIIGGAMSLDPSARPQNADDLGRALRRFLAGVDLGDLARQLGERVRAVRERPPSPANAPANEHPPLQRPPSRPTATQVGTKTFAARDDVRVADAALIPQASTRRLDSDPPAAREPTRRTPRLALGAGALVLTVATFILGRRGTPQPTKASEVPTRSPPSTVPVMAASDVPAPRPVQVEPGPSATVAAAERAQIILLGDGTLVSVDGSPRRSCPTRIAVTPGAHAIVFSFPPTGESKDETVTLRSGERATLRADFTGASPTIHVQRP